MKEKWFAKTIAVVVSVVMGSMILIGTLNAGVLVANPIKPTVNGQEIMSAINPSSPMSISKEQIASLIRNQGRDNKDTYYMDGLSYEVTNLDDDTDLEIVANIDGAVHLGNFFIFDKDANGAYKLITEQDWKVERWNLDSPIDIEGKKVFKLETRTGGTGIDNFTVHLWYLEQGKFIEAWQGTMQERIVFAETYSQKVCGYQVDTYSEKKRLYAWETTLDYQLEQDGVTPKGDIKSDTTTMVYLFNGTRFIPEKAKASKN